MNREGKKTLEYLEHNLHDSALRAVLVRAYEQYQLFHKSFSHTLKATSSLHLRETLDHFFTTFISTLLIPTLDIITSLSGIHHLNLTQLTYLSLISFIRDLSSRLPPYAKTLFLYKHYLAHHDLPSLDTLRPVYEYITNPETGKVDDGIVNQVKGKGEAVVGTRPMSLRPGKVGGGGGIGGGLGSLFGLRRESGKFSGFLVGPVGGEVPEPKVVYLGEEGWEHYVLVYQYQEDNTLLIFIPTVPPPDATDEAEAARTIRRRIRDRAFFADLKLFFDERFPALAKELADNWGRGSGSSDTEDPSTRFVRLGKTNNGFETSVKASKASHMPEEAVRTIGGLHEEFGRSNSGLESVYMKTGTDMWVVGRRSDDEEVYAVMQRQELGLVEVEDEIQKLHALKLDGANVPTE
ncbi:vacuolar fusion protein ccz1 [Rhizophlyctis rosea]|nr:vacuolar fusion protein ccz1 [Rhizophlyctis rosea]